MGEQTKVNGMIKQMVKKVGTRNLNVDFAYEPDRSAFERQWDKGVTEDSYYDPNVVLQNLMSLSKNARMADADVYNKVNGKTVDYN